MFDVMEKILWVMSLINNTDLYFLTAISIQRCLSVMFPIWYRCQQPRHLSTIVSVLLWLLSLLVIGLEVYFCTYEKGCIKITIFNFIINILIFTPLMVLSSLTLFIKIWCTSLQCQPSKLYVIIWLNILFFLIFALPLRITVMLSFLRCMVMPQLVISLVILLASVNSSMNPILYFLVGNHGKKHIMQPLKEVFERIFQEETDPGEERDTPTMDTEQTLTQTQA
ncbi:mas-related G-protein coupled receptor member H-like [Alligator mississippiensis]|uniref:mas-related G-protein coupled receptor member H-like n=1 Tax=Alligator mississippiensis TaxID=8496 RepID=UPI0003D07CDF|nr:mas-related G-protein coupled receptor member H-like [Alligator mississippiensis]